MNRGREVTANMMTRRLGASQVVGVDLCACFGDSTRQLGTVVYCADCCDAILDGPRARMLASTADGIGHGRQVGLLRSDYGPGWGDLACTGCTASWVGPFGESCGWCRRRMGWIVDRQRLLVLRPALPDRDMPNRQGALDAWADRLAVAVDSRLVTAAEADGAEARARAS